jgi:DNA polymerase III epsilon subunit family exonuclease
MSRRLTLGWGGRYVSHEPSQQRLFPLLIGDAALNLASGSIRPLLRDSPIERTLATLKAQGKPVALGYLAEKLLALRAPPPPAVARRVVAALVGAAAAGLPDPIDLGGFGLARSPRPGDWSREETRTSDEATLRLSEAEFVVVDLETTGLSPRTCTILEIGAVRVAATGARDCFATLVNPNVSIPPAIRALAGIDDGMVAGAPQLAEALTAFLRWLGRFPCAPFVAHNASFDANFMARGLQAAGLPPLEREVLCTRRLAKRVLPELRRLGLDRLTCHFGVVNRAPHRALGDAEATAEVLLRLLDLARWRAGVATLADLFELDGKTPAQVRKRLEPLPGGLRTLSSDPLPA